MKRSIELVAFDEGPEKGFSLFLNDLCLSRESDPDEFERTLAILTRVLLAVGYRRLERTPHGQRMIRKLTFLYLDHQERDFAADLGHEMARDKRYFPI